MKWEKCNKKQIEYLLEEWLDPFHSGKSQDNMHLALLNAS